MIFFIRFITAAALFAFLGKANLWMSPVSNIILAIGYRFFLITSPIFDRIAGKHAIALALLLSSAGALLFCFSLNVFFVLAALLVSMGLSVAGYLIKAEASESPKGAAHNKIALNAGSLFSGLILLIPMLRKNIFFIISAAVFLVCSGITFFISHRKKAVSLPKTNLSNIEDNFIWIMIGMAVGIKLFGVLSVLPQFLLAQQSQLPAWYGITLFVNSAMIILLQLPIIHWVEKRNAHSDGSRLTLFVMMLGMVIIAFPGLFLASSFFGAMIWTVSLSIVECFASYLDVSASRAGSLFVKEVSVGLGGGIAVLFSRLLPVSYSSISLGLVGGLMLCVAYWYFFKKRPLYFVSREI